MFFPVRPTPKGDEGSDAILAHLFSNVKGLFGPFGKRARKNSGRILGTRYRVHSKNSGDTTQNSFGVMYDVPRTVEHLLGPFTVDGAVLPGYDGGCVRCPKAPTRPADLGAAR